MNEVANHQSIHEKPADIIETVKFPPLPDPTSDDFNKDISDEERKYYQEKFTDINSVTSCRLHCTACDRHLGSAAQNECRMRSHPMLRTLMCQTCHTFYNSGEFEKGDDGSELYCRWCGQGGQVYCCSDCPHVFCAKCIKRNLGLSKIKEIENNDDWKCFKCNPTCLWNLRAVCWALLRYCALKNKITYQTADVVLKEAYLKDCAIDYSECCKHKVNKRRSDVRKKYENLSKRNTVVPPKPMLTPTIQVKKFASINPEEKPVKVEKKPIKRSASPKNKIYIKNPLAIAPMAKVYPPININMNKKMKIQSPLNIRVGNDKGLVTFTNIRPKTTYNFSNMPVLANHFNGSNIANDNINLSLESLTQGLDMTTVASIANSSQKDDVVCTPDFPLEPMCEVTEDNADDDVQCITPGPVSAPKPSNPPLPPLVRPNNAIPDLSPENIIQMTENDVTVNASTGGLKFRVDPQTLSSQKMYRLPDGRIFAINSNPNMPGGYSATIVAVTDNAASKVPKGVTYAAKLSAVPLAKSSTPIVPARNQIADRPGISKRKPQNAPKRLANKSTDNARILDFNVPVEWFRYNLIDAVDALEYALPRLQKLKKECTTLYLRNRKIDEMRDLTRVLGRLLNTSSTRFTEINDSLQNDLRQFIAKKFNSNCNASEDDDDVEILPSTENDDPIFIDENSIESHTLGNECQEVDLTGHVSSEQNDSVEKSISNEDPFANITMCLNSIANQSVSVGNKHPLSNAENLSSNNENQLINTENSCISNSILLQSNEEDISKNQIEEDISKNQIEEDISKNQIEEDITKIQMEEDNLPATLLDSENEDPLKNKDLDEKTKVEEEKTVNGKEDINEQETSNHESSTKSDSIDDEEVESDVTNIKINVVKVEEEKSQDTEMTEEMINSLLEDDKDGLPDSVMDTD